MNELVVTIRLRLRTLHLLVRNAIANIVVFEHSLIDRSNFHSQFWLITVLEKPDSFL